MPKRRTAGNFDIPDASLDDVKEFTVQDTAYDSREGILASTSTEFNLPRSPVKKKSKPTTARSEPAATVTADELPLGLDAEPGDDADSQPVPPAEPVKVRAHIHICIPCLTRP